MYIKMEDFLLLLQQEPSSLYISMLNLQPCFEPKFQGHDLNNLEFTLSEDARKVLSQIVEQQFLRRKLLNFLPIYFYVELLNLFQAQDLVRGSRLSQFGIFTIHKSFGINILVQFFSIFKDAHIFSLLRDYFTFRRGLTIYFDDRIFFFIKMICAKFG